MAAAPVDARKCQLIRESRKKAVILVGFLIAYAKRNIAHIVHLPIEHNER